MNKLRTFIAVILTVSTLSYSRPSQATVGAFVSVPVLVAGIVITGGGYWWTGKLIKDCGGDGLCGLAILITGPIMLVGLVVLDGEQPVAFRELDEDEASRLGISKSELAIFNSEVDQANMLLADVKTELSKVEKPTAQDSAIAWSEVRDLVSPATYTVMQKIVSQK